MDLDQQLSSSYTVRDLIGTSTGIPNIPSEAYLPNLTALAELLDFLKEIDDFTIESGFRSPAVNSAVGGADYSYHSDGLAADIIPKTMSARDFWSYIHNNPRYRNAVGEYALKEDRNTPNIHVSTPTTAKVAFDLVETSPGVYVRSNIPFDDSYKLPSAAPVLIFGVLGIGLVLFTLYRVRKAS